MVKNISTLESILFQYTTLVINFFPIFFFFPRILLYPSIESIILFLIGLMSWISIRILLQNIEDIRIQKEILSGFLKRFSKCDFHEIGLKDYYEARSLISINTTKPTFSLFRHSYKLDLEGRFKIYCVKRGSSTILPNQFVTYEFLGDSFPSYIFIRDEPNKITPIGRFFLFHEVGHTGRQIVSLKADVLFGWKTFYLAIYLATINIQFNPLPLCILAGYIIFLYVLRPPFIRSLHYQSYYEEISADRYALNCLSNSDQLSLANYIERSGQLPFDLSISNDLNNERSKQLKQDLRIVKDMSGKVRPIEFFYLSNVYRILSVFAIFIPIIGFFTRKPSMNLIGINFLFMVVPLFLFLRSSSKSQGLYELIESYLIKKIK